MNSTEADKMEIKKYLPGMQSLLEHSISPEQFVYIFLDVRRNDDYLWSGQYCADIEQILSYLFSAVDRHAPVELYEDGDIDIDDDKLIEIVKENYLILLQKQF
jgi:hypothetical protein